MTALSISDLSYDYDTKQALKSVSFDIPAGKFCALLGPNGAGKSTLFGLLTRLFVAPRGDITVAGHNLKQNPRRALAKIGVVFQQPTIDLDLSVAQNLKYFAALQGLNGLEAATRIDEALERLGMAERAHEKARALNGGHRRRMEIARALIHKPSVLLLDEPTVGLDAPSRTAITDYVHDLTQQGISVLWATHLVDEIKDDDQLIVLHEGEIKANGETGTICANQTLAERFATLTGAE